jgi:hypothetical protein
MEPQPMRRNDPNDIKIAQSDAELARIGDVLLELRGKFYALEQGCRQLELDSGVQRFGAHRFYLREGFDISSHHFSIEDLASSKRG